MRIVLKDDYEEVSLPTCNDLLDLNDALNRVVMVMHAEAQRNPTKGNWEAYLSLRAACDDIHGAAGWLAKQEGLVK